MRDGDEDDEEEEEDGEGERETAEHFEKKKTSKLETRACVESFFFL